MKRQEPSPGVPKVVSKMMRHFRAAQEAEQDARRMAKEDFLFYLGEQWDLSTVNERNIDKRPALTINRMPQFVKQVTNEGRKNKRSLSAIPTHDSQGDKETAEIIGDMFRTIQQNSDADAAYQTAMDHAGIGGFGYWRVSTDWENELSFNQVIRVERIANPFMVYYDPDTKEADHSDAMYCLVVTDMTHEAYREQFGGDTETYASLVDFVSTGDEMSGWFTEDYIRVCEYFWVEKKKDTLCRLAVNGIPVGVRFKGDMSDGLKEEIEAGRIQVMEEREAERKVCWSALCNAIQVLDKTEVPSSHIPIVRLTCEEFHIDGDRHTFGMVRNAKDPQKMLNFWASSEAETITLAPKAPFIGAVGSFEGQENKWRTANVKSHAYLEYVPVVEPNSGALVPPPQRNSVEPAIQAISTARRNAGEDLKDVFGIYDANLGSRSNEVSGVAISRRQEEGEKTHFNLHDNLNRAIRLTGKIILEMIPRVYTEERVLELIGENGKTKQAHVINDPNQPAKQEVPNPEDNGQTMQKIFNVGVGAYDVTVTSGPSFETKRRETAEQLKELVASYPDLMTQAGDLLIASMDIGKGEEIAKRMYKMLPPELKDEDPMASIPPQVQQQLQQLEQENGMLKDQITMAMEMINSKRLELDSKERIAALKAHVDLIKTEAELTVEQQMAFDKMNTELDKMQMQLQQRTQAPKPEPMPPPKPPQPASPQAQGGEGAPPMGPPPGPPM